MKRQKKIHVIARRLLVVRPFSAIRVRRPQSKMPMAGLEPARAV
jgi:hypothetical protein